MTIGLAHYEWKLGLKELPDGYYAPAGVLGSIDLRTEAQCGKPNNAGDGFTIFDFADDAILPADCVVLGSLGDSLKPSQRDLALSAIGSKTQGVGGTVAEFIYELMTLHADPYGEANHRPVMPTVGRQFEIHLSGQLLVAKRFDPASFEGQKVQAVLREQFIANKAACVKGDMPPQQYLKVLDFEMQKLGVSASWLQPDGSNEQPIKHETVFTETWPTNGTTISSGQDQAWTKTGSIQVTSGALQVSNSFATDGHAVCNTVLSSADHYAQSDIAAGTTSGRTVGNAVRFDSSLYTCYAAMQNGAAADPTTYRMSKFSSGTQTNIGSGVNANRTATKKLVVNGSTLTSYSGGSLVDTQTDSTISSGVRAGIVFVTAVNTLYTSDNFEAGDLSSSGLGPVFGGRAIGKGRVFGGSAIC